MKTHLVRRGVSRHSLALLVACCAALVAVGAETGPPAGDPSQPVCDYTANARITEKGENLALQVDEKIEVRNTSVQELEVSLPIHNQEIKDSLKLSVDGKPVDEVSGLKVPAGTNVTIAAAFEQSPLAPKNAATITLPPDYWFPTLAHKTPGRDSYKVKLDVPPGYAVAASGVLDPQTGMWSAESLRNFGVVLLKNGDVLEKNVHGTLLRCLHFENQKEAAKQVFDTAADVIAFYKGRFGFYPFKSLTIVPGDSRPMGGYPFASCMVVIHGMENFEQKPEIHWRWITAHEIGHQYWGEHVLSSSNVNWLMIGLGIYADREYVGARKLGNSRHKAILSRYVDGVRSHLDTTVEFKKRPSFDFNNVVVHGKGYGIISALACLLGEETFARIHNRCLREYAGKAMYAEDLRAGERPRLEELLRPVAENQPIPVIHNRID